MTNVDTTGRWGFYSTPQNIPVEIARDPSQVGRAITFGHADRQVIREWAKRLNGTCVFGSDWSIVTVNKYHQRKDLDA